MLVGEPRIHYDADAALGAFAALNAADIDLLLVCCRSPSPTPPCVTEIAGKLEVPLVLWTFPEARTGGRLRLNSFCGVNLAQHTLSRRGKALENVHGAPDSADALAGIRTRRRAAAIVRDLARAKILVVGDHPTGFDACNYNADEIARALRRRVGDHAGQRVPRQRQGAARRGRRRALRPPRARTSRTWARWTRSPRARR